MERRPGQAAVGVASILALAGSVELERRPMLAPKRKRKHTGRFGKIVAKRRRKAALAAKSRKRNRSAA